MEVLIFMGGAIFGVCLTLLAAIEGVVEFTKEDP